MDIFCERILAMLDMGRMMRPVMVGGVMLVAVAVTVVFMAGCKQMPQFPDRPMRLYPTSDGGKIIAFDTNKDYKADYWQRANVDGRKTELKFSDHSEWAETTIKLDDIHSADVPHFIIAMDGVPYTLVEELYNQGCFRLFYRPSRVVSSFPGMTDIAFQQIFGGKRT